jgi:hypothetical protein
VWEWGVWCCCGEGDVVAEDYCTTTCDCATDDGYGERHSENRVSDEDVGRK